MPIYITATGKKDGLGSQLLSKILGMIFAKKIISLMFIPHLKL